MIAAAHLRNKIESGELTTGALATFHFWPGLVELIMRAELDYLIIDMEHLTHDPVQVAEACAIGRRNDFPILVRPPSAEFTPVRLAMDLGPCGLLLPYIESLETLQEARDAIYMKPRGRRRPGGLGNFWVQDYHYQTWKREVEEQLVILPQIESKKGLENVDAIASDPLTTAIAIGPYDLSADLGVCWDPEAPELLAAIQQIRDAGKAAGKNMWMIGDGPTLVSQGFTFLCIGEATMAMEGALRELKQKAHTGESGSVDQRPLP